MPSTKQRRAALDALLANGGQGVIANDPRRYTDVVRPGLSGADSAGTVAADRMWDERNAVVGKAAHGAVGGFGAALETLRRKNAILALQGRATGGGGGGGSSGAAAAASPAGPAATEDDPWAWVGDYLDDQPYMPAPSPQDGGGQGPYPSSRGRGMNAPVYRLPAPKQKPRPTRGAY